MTAVQKAISLYKGRGFGSLFAGIRFWDAPFLEADRLVPKQGKLLDLGCGEGLFTNFLALSSPSRDIIGIELNKRRLKNARRGLRNVSYLQGDVLTTELPMADAITMVHLLHHLPSFEDQIKLLKKSKKALRPGGRLIIVEVDRKPFMKYLLSWWVDHFLVSWLFDHKLYSKIFFRKEQEWNKVLKSFGFRCRTHPAHAGKPFSHVIFECEI